MSEMSSLIVNPLNDSQTVEESSSENELIRQDVISESNCEVDKNPLMDSEGEEQVEDEKQLSSDNSINYQKANLQVENDEGTQLEYHVCQTQLVWDQQNEAQKTNFVCSCDDVKLQQFESNNSYQKDSGVCTALQQEIQSKDSQILILQQQNQDIKKALQEQIFMTKNQQQEINEIKNINERLKSENDSLKNELINTQRELHQVTLLAYQDKKIKHQYQQEMTHRSKTSTDFAQKQQNYQVIPSNATLNDNNIPPLSPHQSNIVKVAMNSKIPNSFVCYSAKNNQQEGSISSATRRSFQLPPQANGVGRKPKLDDQQKSLKELIHKAQLSQLIQKSKSKIVKVNGQSSGIDAKFFISKKPLVKITERHPQI